MGGRSALPAGDPGGGRDLRLVAAERWRLAPLDRGCDRTRTLGGAADDSHKAGLSPRRERTDFSERDSPDRERGILRRPAGKIVHDRRLHGGATVIKPGDLLRRGASAAPGAAGEFG